MTLKKLHCAIYQAEVSHENWQIKYTKLREKISKTSAELIICPELFASSYIPNINFIKSLSQTSNGEYFQDISKLCSQFSKTVVMGYPEIENNKYFISTMVVNHEGQLIANHRKQVLAPGDFEKNLFSVGTDMTYFNFKDIKCSILICYEFEFPELFRKAAFNNCEVIIVPTALSSKWSTISYEMLRTRALENQINIIYANQCGTLEGTSYMGHSAIVNIYGQDLVRVNHEENLFSHVMEIESPEILRSKLPYLNDLKKIK